MNDVANLTIISDGAKYYKTYYGQKWSSMRRILLVEFLIYKTGTAWFVQAAPVWVYPFEG